MLRVCSGSLVLVVLALHFLKPSHGFVTTVIPIAKKITCRTNAKYMNVTSYIRQQGSITNQSIDIEMVFLREMREMKLTVTFYPVLGNRSIQNALLTRGVNMCRFLSNPNDRFIKAIYDHVRKHSYLPVTCPFQPDHYYIRDLQLKTTNFMAFLPQGDFVLAFVFDMGPQREMLANWRFYGRLMRFKSEEIV